MRLPFSSCCVVNIHRVWDKRPAFSYKARCGGVVPSSIYIEMPEGTGMEVSQRWRLRFEMN